MKAIVELAFFFFVIIMCCSVSSCSMFGESKATKEEVDAFYAGYILGSNDGCVHAFRYFQFPEEHCKQHKEDVMIKIAKKLADEEEANE